MAPTVPPTDAELDALIRARLQLIGVDLNQLPVSDPPEIAFPIGFQPHAASGREVPIGAIIGGRPFEEDRLLALAGAFQTATGWHLRRPADPAPVGPAARIARERLRLTAEEVEELTQ